MEQPTQTHSVTFYGTTMSELTTNILNFIGDTASMTPTANVPVRKTTKAASPVTAEMETDQMEMDFSDDAPMGDGEIDSDRSVDIEFDLKTDIIPAFRAYAKRHTAKAAGKILARFKAKSVNDLKIEDYPKVMEIIG